MFSSLLFGLLFIHFVFCFSAKHDVLVVLGSADDRILSERISAAVQYIQTSDSPIILFISGGVKNAFDNATTEPTITEAAKAARFFDTQPFTPLNIYNGTHEGVPLDVKGQPLPIVQLNGNPQQEDCSTSNVHRGKHVQIVLDEHATNTAENFAYLKRWVDNNFSQDDLPDFVITTSDFHHNRAERIFQGILPDVTPKWNLSKSSCSRCWSDENIHLRNVPTDILKARLIM